MSNYCPVHGFNITTGCPHEFSNRSISVQDNPPSEIETLRAHVAKLETEISTITEIHNEQAICAETFVTAMAENATLRAEVTELGAESIGQSERARYLESEMIREHKRAKAAESERDQLRAQLDESEAWLFDTEQDRDEILAELEKAESHIVQLSGESDDREAWMEKCILAEAQLEAVRGLPDEWRNDASKAEFELSKDDCADELEQALSTNKPAG